MSLALVTATKKEMAAVLTGQDGLPCLQVGSPGAWIDTAGRQWLLLVTGLGIINTALHLGALLSRESGVRGVLNLGLAGSFDLKRLPFYTPLLVSKEIWPEFGLSTREGVDPHGLGYGLGRLHGTIVRNQLSCTPKKSLLSMGLRVPQDWQEGTSITVSGVSADLTVKERLDRAYGPDIENMEGFALAWVCLQCGLPFAEVRVVSNLVGSRERKDWDLQGSLHVLSRVFAALLGDGDADGGVSDR